ncbi:hypothetical protein [Pseudarthrobacter sp. S9]
MIRHFQQIQLQIQPPQGVVGVGNVKGVKAVLAGAGTGQLIDEGLN